MSDAIPLDGPGSHAADLKELRACQARIAELEAVTRRLPPPLDVYVLPLSIHDHIRELEDENGRLREALKGYVSRQKHVDPGSTKWDLLYSDAIRALANKKEGGT